MTTDLTLRQALLIALTSRTFSSIVTCRELFSCHAFRRCVTRRTTWTRLVREVCGNFALIDKLSIVIRVERKKNLFIDVNRYQSSTCHRAKREFVYLTLRWHLLKVIWSFDLSCNFPRRQPRKLLSEVRSSHLCFFPADPHLIFIVVP